MCRMLSSLYSNRSEVIVGRIHMIHYWMKYRLQIRLGIQNLINHIEMNATETVVIGIEVVTTLAEEILIIPIAIMTHAMIATIAITTGAAIEADTIAITTAGVATPIAVEETMTISIAAAITIETAEIATTIVANLTIIEIGAMTQDTTRIVIRVTTRITTRTDRQVDHTTETAMSTGGRDPGRAIRMNALAQGKLRSRNKYRLDR